MSDIIKILRHTNTMLKKSDADYTDNCFLNSDTELDAILIEDICLPVSCHKCMFRDDTMSEKVLFVLNPS